MATPTYDLIASQVSNGTPSVITFSSIPATYRDLILVTSSPATGSGANQLIANFNSDTGTNYARVTMLGTGSSTSSDSTATGTSVIAGVRGTNSPTVGILQIMDYSATDKHKTCLCRTNISEFNVRADAFRWANTAAINTITVQLSLGGSINSGISFYLYGISA